MSLSQKVLLTGGTGRLGLELRQLLPNVIAPLRFELDLLKPETIDSAMVRYAPDVVVHAAAYTNVAGAERERELCWRVNVEGTRNIVGAVTHHRAFLIHISTDYVFEGSRGGYTEEEPPGPVRNYYALSKLVAEELVRVARRHLVIRTSFRPREWPYPTAFADVFTSQDYVDVIAPMIAQVVERHREISHSTLHIATERKSVYELARRRKPDVRAGSRADAEVQLPADISLDTARWQQLKAQWREHDQQ